VPVCHCRLIEGKLQRIPSNTFVLLRLQLIHLGGRQREIVELSILLDPTRRHALGQRHVALLQAPSEQDLRRGLAVLLGQLDDERLTEALPPDDGTVGLEGDVALGAPRRDVDAWAPGVDLVLRHGDDAPLSLASALLLQLGDVGLQLLEMVQAVVADPDASDLTRLDGLDERLPDALAVDGSTVRGVDQHEIDVVYTGVLQALVDLGLGLLIAEPLGRRDLGGVEDVGPGDATLLHCGADTGFIAVEDGRVHMSVADFEGL
jgi:hypothetical protein